MMVSWACVAYFTLQAMTTPFRGVLLQTQKQDKVIQLIRYAKCLYSQQDSELQAGFRIASSIPAYQADRPAARFATAIRQRE
jgi:hypothetical protein